MKVEIKRTTWGRFWRKFNAVNWHRRADLVVKARGEDAISIYGNSPFMGLAVTKSGRTFDGVDFFSCVDDPDKPVRPVLSLKGIVKITAERDEKGGDCGLAVESSDGCIARLSLVGERDDQHHRSCVEKVAYSLCKKRGFAPGEEVNDWIEAERRIKEAELELVP